MTAFTPEWRIKIDGDNLTAITLVGLTINSGRTNINTQPQASYCQLELINTNNTDYGFDINAALTVELKDSTATYVPIFGGKISDVSVGVRSAGSSAYVTSYQITALGVLAKLQKAVWTAALSQDDDGDQIYTILSDLLLNTWNEVSASQTWAAYNPATTWATAENIGLGQIDQPGQYEMEQRSANPIDYYSIVSQIANSALGYIYEDANGNIGYADSAHRTTYLAANGYVDLSANDALALGIRATTRQGALVNSFVLNYGNAFNSQKTALDQDSIDTYGRFQVTQNSLVHDATDAQNIANRYVQLRAYPRAQFEKITFALQNPEISNSDRDALIGIFMGLPVRITDLPALITGGGFEGYVEGWTWRVSVSGLSIDLTLSPTAFSAVAQNWDQVNASEKWNTLLNTLEWQDAIGVIS
jgi:hypothetical protein